jgi:hypothetical protein
MPLGCGLDVGGAAVAQHAGGLRRVDCAVLLADAGARRLRDQRATGTRTSAAS